jgi:predicted TIM-barrel fold metal-dependent hydrolase
VKLNCGYVRSLRFDDVSEEEAQRIWDLAPQKRSVAQQRALQDHLARFVIARSAHHGLPIQIHAAVGDTPGLLWANASPANLEPVFADPSFGGPTVVLLHGGLPASQLAGWYAATYANVFLDYSWLPILSDVILSRCLEEWLDYVPYTKLLFGTDAWSPELFYGGTVAARQILAGVLEDRVGDGRWSAGLAELVARRILAENARSLYDLPER